MLRRSAPQAMLRATGVALGGGMKPYHEWQMHEPLLIDYEGWRILDTNKMTKTEAWLTDIVGIGRHLDPIIDDPRLTHKQRVCRLYRWALKEMMNYMTNNNAWKFNIGYKVVRARFEKYRYVTDPGMCDMMVRETQKYLREICSTAFMRRDPRSKDSIAVLTNPMFHPDNGLVYDHWTMYEEQLYGDAKVHRYAGHHPNMSALPEMHERYGDHVTARMYMRRGPCYAMVVYYLYVVLWGIGAFYVDGWHDPHFDEMLRHYKHETIQAMDQFEKSQRARYSQAATLSYDWDLVLGKIYQKEGYIDKGSANYYDDIHKMTPRNPFENHPYKI